ncbi:MAG: GGDEF domain-containing protein [Candidatus Aquicultor sp.]
MLKVIVIISIIIMIYASLRCRKCIALIPETYYSNYWKGLTSLILFFIAGYIFYGYSLFANINISNERLVVSLVLFFGSIFVLLVTVLSYNAFSEIINLQKETQSYAECLEQEVKKRTKRLEELSITDSLTGLYNQGFFFRKLDEEITRAIRQNGSLFLLLFDIDKFKNYNDIKGHLEGDRVLHMTGSIVRDSIRNKVDSGFRYGGDEFTVILPNTEKDEAVMVAKRIMAALNKKEISISVGLVPCGCEQLDAKTLLKIADKAMYEAKTEGGNRIKLFRPEPSGESGVRQLG